jgi:hypothetical protein
MTESAKKTESDDKKAHAPAAGQPMLVVDLRRRQSRKQIRGLRKGTGRLATKVQDMVQEIRESSGLKGNARDPAIVVIVREKRKRDAFGFI